MITEDYVPFEIAKLLKEKGFDCFSHCVYNTNGTLIHSIDAVGGYCIIKSGYYLCPSYSMVMRWLREEKKIDIVISIIEHYTVTMEQDYYLPKVYKDRRLLTINLGNTLFHTYELASEAAIKYILEKII